MDLTLEERRRVAELAAEMNRITGGRRHADGTSRTFAQIEKRTVEATDLLAREMLKSAAEDEPIDLDACPCCGRVTVRDGDEPQLLLTERGEIGWTEATRHCGKCRRAFFPESG